MPWLSKLKLPLLVVLAVFFPFLIRVQFFFLAEAFHGQFPAYSVIEFLGITGGVAFGVLCINFMPLGKKIKLPVSVLYWLIFTVLLEHCGWVLGSIL